MCFHSLTHLQVSSCDVSSEWASVSLGLVTSLTEQLRFADADLIADDGADDNSLCSSLAALVRKSSCYPASEALREAGCLLGRVVQTRFNLSVSCGDKEEEEAEEEKPAVWEAEVVPVDADGVPLPEDGGAPASRMSWMVSSDTTHKC